MKRTTISLDERLLRKLKADAAAKGATLTDYVNELIKQAIGNSTRTNLFKLHMSGWNAETQPGVDILDRDKLFDLTDGR